jgi:septal ring factor EnvC (AmiA/AmiB activator)
MSEKITPSNRPRAGLFRSGWQEVGRKLQRRKLRKHAQQLEQQRTTALGQLGQRAWEGEIDLSRSPDLRDQVGRLEGRAGELTTATTKLSEEKSALESRRQAETGRFDASRQTVDDKKRPADAALKAAKERLREQEKAIKRLETRNAALPAEMASLEEQIASLAINSLPDKSARLGAAQNQKQQLELEQRHVAEQLALAQQGLPPLAAEVQRLQAESQGYVDEINRIEAERKSVLTPIVAELDRVRRDVSAATQQATAVEQEKQGRLVQLGLALYEGEVSDPSVASSIEQVSAIDRDRTSTQAKLEASLAQTRAMRSGTMPTFWSMLVLVPAVILASGLAAYHFLAPAGQTSETPLGWVHKEEERRDTILKSYIEGNQKPSQSDSTYASLRHNAVQILKEDIRRLGETGDHKYMPQLAKTLRSSEPELRVATADAMRTIGPTLAEAPALSSALNDPVPAVRVSCLHALERLPKESRAQLLVGRTLEELRPVGPAQQLQSEETPQAERLGVAAYPNAAFLYFASNLAEGRAAYTSADSVKQVLNFYQTKGQRGPLTLEEFGREYLGPSVLDQATAKQMVDESKAWVADGSTGTSPGELEAQAPSRDTRRLQYLVFRYSNAKFYGAPACIVTEETGPEKKPVRFVVVFEDRALNATGLIIHFPPSEQ